MATPLSEPFCQSQALALDLAFEGLLQNVQLLVELGQLLALGADFADSVQHGGMVTATKQFANFGQAFLG